MDAMGSDDTGHKYATPQELWESVARRAGGNAAPAAAAAATSGAKGEHAAGPEWYRTNVEYWDAQAPTDNGVLGGFGFVADVDIRDSAAFLLKALGPALQEAAEGKRPPMVALDCGAGVGRVCEALLLHHFQEVDLVEPSAHLLAAAKKRLGGRGPHPWPRTHRAVGYFGSGLEAFHPEAGRYDALWIQWAMLYLTDADATAFLKRCAAALKPGGAILIKENVCASGFEVDTADASVTRSHAYNSQLYTQGTGLRLAHTALQRDFPRQLFKVRMYALKADAGWEEAA